MPINHHWDNDSDHIMIQVFDGQWTLDDFFADQRNLKADVLTKAHHVHIICMFKTSITPPAMLLSAARKIENTLSSNMGLIILVNARGLEKTLVHAAAEIMPDFTRRVRGAHSLDEARLLVSAEQQIDKGSL